MILRIVNIRDTHQPADTGWEKAHSYHPKAWHWWGDGIQQMILTITTLKKHGYHVYPSNLNL